MQYLIYLNIYVKYINLAIILCDTMVLITKMSFINFAIQFYTTITQLTQIWLDNFQLCLFSAKGVNLIT